MLLNRVCALIFALGVTFSVQSWAELCEPSGQGQGKTVTFPNGRELTIYGHTHGVTSDVMALGQQLALDTKSSNDQYILKSIMQLLALSETRDQYRKQVADLKSRISSGKLNFIALEHGDQIMQMMSEQVRAFLPMTRKNFENRKLNINDEKLGLLVDSAFLVFAGPAHYLAQTDPELMKTVVIVGVEDDDLMQRSLDMQSDAVSRLEGFLKVAGNVDGLKEFMTQALMRVIFEYDLHQFLEDDWIMKEIEQRVPKRLVNKAKDPISSALAAAELMRRRDQKSSAKLLGQQDSGVLLIGSAHVRSMSNKVRTECLNKKI